MEHKLDIVVDELHYALTTGNVANKEHYVSNAIRFIEEYKECMDEKLDEIIRTAMLINVSKGDELDKKSKMKIIELCKTINK